MGLTSFNLAWIFEWSCSYSWNRTAVLVPVYWHRGGMTREAMGGDVHPLSLYVLECLTVKNRDNLTVFSFLRCWNVFWYQAGTLPLLPFLPLFSFKVWQGHLWCQISTWKPMKGRTILILTFNIIWRGHFCTQWMFFTITNRLSKSLCIGIHHFTLMQTIHLSLVSEGKSIFTWTFPTPLLFSSHWFIQWLNCITDAKRCAWYLTDINWLHTSSKSHPVHYHYQV